MKVIINTNNPSRNKRKPGMLFYSGPGVYSVGSDCDAIYLLLSREPGQDWLVAIFQCCGERLFGAQVEFACDERLDILKPIGTLMKVEE